MFRSCCCFLSLPPLEGNVWLLYHHFNAELFLPGLSQVFFFFHHSLPPALLPVPHSFPVTPLFFFPFLPATAVCYILWFLHRNSSMSWITGSVQVCWSHDRIRNFLLQGGARVWVHRWKAFPLLSDKKKFSHHNNKTHRVSASSTTAQMANARVQSARYLICMKRC